jgi:HrpA-like RNA helicase
LSTLVDLGAVAVARRTAKYDPASPQIQLTAKGKRMAGFPLDPLYSNLLLRAEEFDCEAEVVAIIAMLDENIFYTPSSSQPELQRRAAECHQRFAHRFVVTHHPHTISLC